MNPPRSARLVFIDWLRGFSILFMIETHTFNSLLKPFLKEEGWFHLLDFFNGLVAPSFLFVSGWAFVAASARKLEDFRRFGQAFWRQLGRIGLIWALGYILHLPGFSFSGLLWARNTPAWQSLFQVDILHCIAAGLLVLFLVRMFVKSDESFERVLWLGIFVVVLAAPAIWGSEGVQRLPSSLSGYWAEHPYALFPLFPWLGFLLLGGACAIAYKRADEAKCNLRFIRWTAILGIILITLGYFFSAYGFPWPYGSRNIRAHPVFFGLRAGYLFLWVWICWQLQKFPAIPSGWLMTLSRESLFVYVAHIVLLYHFPLDHSTLVGTFGKSLAAWECAAVTVGLLVVMCAMARVWSWIKSRHKRGSQVLTYAAGVGATLLFCFR